MSRPRSVSPPIRRRLPITLLLCFTLSLVSGGLLRAATPALSVSITDTLITAEPGDLLTYTVRARNTGVALTNVRLHVTIPANTTFVAASDSPSDLGGGTYRWDLATLGAGATIFRYLTVQVDAPVATGTVLTATAAIDQLGDPKPNTAADTTIVRAPMVTLAPTSLLFADQLVGIASPAQAVTLTNTGDAPLSIGAITISGDFSQSHDCPIAPATLAPGASCTIGMTFTPTTTGARTGTLAIADSAVGSPHTVALSGRGIGPAVMLDQTTLDFGYQRVGTTSAAQTVTLTSSGEAALTIASIGVSGDYALDATTCPVGTPLAPGASCTISVVFVPSTTGTRGGTLTISSDAPSSPDQVALTGIGALPAIGVTPGSIDFGNQRVGSTSAPRVVTISNEGFIAPEISAISIAPAGPLAIADNQCPATLPVGGSCTVAITFRPSATGGHSATLSIVDSAAGSPHTVALSGTGVQPAVTLDPTSIDFGTQRVGTTSAARTITLTNSGSEALLIGSITPSGSFAVSGTTCPIAPATLAPSASCTISVTFTPPTTGAHTGMIAITDDAPGSPHTVALSGTGVQPAVTLDPTSIDYGNQRVGVTSAPRSVTITNSGSAPLRITTLSLAPGGEFSFGRTSCPVGSGTLAAGASCIVSITFRPSTTGSRSATLSVNNDAPGSPHRVTLTGTGALPAVTLDPTTLDFGDQRVGIASAARAVTLTNSGGVALSISSLGIAPGGEFAFSGTTCPLTPSTLAAGASCIVSITFMPSATGSRSATLSVSSDAPGSPQAVALTGRGVVPSADVAPKSLDFGSQILNTFSAPEQVTLTNSGDGPLTIGSIAPSGDFGTTGTTCPLSPDTLAPGASCTIEVVFMPTALGARGGTLTISNDAPDSPHTVALSGIGVQPTVALDPTSLDFGNQTVNTTSAAQTVTLTNSGDGPLTISGISSSGDFAQSHDCPLAPSTLTPSASCTISVTFTPTATGARSATLTISDNAPGSPHTVSLAGNGLAALVALSPTSLEFGNQRVGVASAPRQVILTNDGTTALRISSITPSGDFSQTNDCPLAPDTLAVSASCTISVTFTPSTIGARSATLTIANDAPNNPHSVPLSGAGVEPGVSLAPTSLAFGTQRMDLPSLPRGVTLANNGTAPLTISAINITGDFSQTNDCPATLAVGASCTIEVVFTPRISGPRAGTLTITDDAAGSPRSVSLSGLGAIIFNPPVTEFRRFLPMAMR